MFFSSQYKLCSIHSAFKLKLPPYCGMEHLLQSQLIIHVKNINIAILLFQSQPTTKTLANKVNPSIQVDQLLTIAREEVLKVLSESE